MTTTGQFLVANSTLPSGTALQHLQALQIGTGNGQTIFASQFLVSVEEPRSEATLRAKKVSVDQVAPRPSVADKSAGKDALFSPLLENRMFVGVGANDMVVRLSSARSMAVTRFDQRHYATQREAE